MKSLKRRDLLEECEVGKNTVVLRPGSEVNQGMRCTSGPRAADALPQHAQLQGRMSRFSNLQHSDNISLQTNAGMLRA